jgi:hypothetical protein
VKSSLADNDLAQLCKGGRNWIGAKIKDHFFIKNVATELKVNSSFVAKKSEPEKNN